ncbi:hypothetical protein ACTVMW_11535 [Serratia bockelmannii]
MQIIKLFKNTPVLPVAVLIKKYALLPLAAMDRSERDSLLSFCSSCKKSFGLLPGQAGATISSHT